jgi:hypothetical protein
LDLGFKVYPPLLGRGAGRPKVQRQRGYLEKNPNKKKVRCPRCPRQRSRKTLPSQEEED